MKELIDEIRLSFEQKANPIEAEKQSTYLKNKFIHFGLKTPVRRGITSPIVRDLKTLDIFEIKSLVDLCFNQKEREFHQFGVDILIKFSKKLESTDLSYIKVKIETNSWWDTVDMLAAKVLGDFLKKYPDLQSEMDKWIDDENMWIRRSALLYQLKYKEGLDEKRLFRYCLRQAHEEEFFIRKVIGWVLREYAKTNRKAVERFVDVNENKLSNLSKKEALR